MSNSSFLFCGGQHKLRGLTTIPQTNFVHSPGLQNTWPVQCINNYPGCNLTSLLKKVGGGKASSIFPDLSHVTMMMTNKLPWFNCSLLPACKMLYENSHGSEFLIGCCYYMRQLGLLWIKCEILTKVYCLGLLRKEKTMWKNTLANTTSRS